MMMNAIAVILISQISFAGDILSVTTRCTSSLKDRFVLEFQSIRENDDFTLVFTDQEECLSTVDAIENRNDSQTSEFCSCSPNVNWTAGIAFGRTFYSTDLNCFEVSSSGSVSKTIDDKNFLVNGQYTDNKKGANYLECEKARKIIQNHK